MSATLDTRIPERGQRIPADSEDAQIIQVVRGIREEKRLKGDVKLEKFETLSKEYMTVSDDHICGLVAVCTDSSRSIEIVKHGSDRVRVVEKTSDRSEMIVLVLEPGEFFIIWGSWRIRFLSP